MPHLTLSLGVTPANIAINNISLKLDSVAYISAAEVYWCTFNHFYVIRPEIYRIRWIYTAPSAITPFKVIQGHRIWY